MLYRHAAVEGAVIVVWNFKNCKPWVYISHSGTQIGKFRSLPEPGLSSRDFVLCGAAHEQYPTRDSALKKEISIDR
jgi:hypothetical protein